MRIYPAWRVVHFTCSTVRRRARRVERDKRVVDAKFSGEGLAIMQSRRRVELRVHPVGLISGGKEAPEVVGDVEAVQGMLGEGGAGDVW